MLIVADQRSPEWLQARKGLITASMAAACLGLDPYTSRQKAWRRIMGIEVQQDNDHMRHGRLHEADAIAAFEVESGSLVTSTGLWVHDIYPWLGASPDGICGDAIIEAKCPMTMPEMVPKHHAIQMAIQMAVLDKVKAYYCVWTPQQFKCWEMKRHLELEAGLIYLLRDFWEQHIDNVMEPKRKGKHDQQSDLAGELGESARDPRSGEWVCDHVLGGDDRTLEG